MTHVAGARHPPPDSNDAPALTITVGKPGSSRGTATRTDTSSPSSTLEPSRIEAGRARLATTFASPPTRAARAPARAATLADQSAWPASAIWAATATASSRNGTAAISSTEAVPLSLWPALLTVDGGTGQPSQPRPRAWCAQAHS